MMFSKLFGGSGAKSAARRAEPGDSEAARLVSAYLEEAMAQDRVWSSTDLKIQNLEAGQKILEAEPSLRIAIVHEAIAQMQEISDRLRKLQSRGPQEWNARYSREGLPLNKRHERLGWLLSRMLRKRLPFDQSDLVSLLRAWASSSDGHPWYWPEAGILKAVETFAERRGLEPELRAALEDLRTSETSKFLDESLLQRVDRQLAEAGQKLVLDNTPFGVGVVGWITGLGQPERDAWNGLVGHAREADTKAKPSAKWLKAAGGYVEAIGAEAISERLAAWLEEFRPGPENPAPSTNFIKGLIWFGSTLDDDSLAPLIGRFCEACYKKLSGVGPANIKLGNACIYALGAMTGERAAAELVRLRSRIKFNQGRKQLDKAIEAAAEQAGLSVQDLEEMALPDFGLDPEGCLRETLGDCTAELRIASSEDVILSWTGPDGEPRKSVPAAVKAEDAEALKDLRSRVKEIKGLLSGQRWRLESLYLQDRRWPLAAWRARYLDHPLLANLSRRLIWRFVEGDDVVDAIPVEKGLVAADGRACDWPGDSAEVSLWHPLGTDAEEVLAWRDRLADLEITQPFKQAHREIYILTDAERATDTYSNRFAAHILKQHQLNALFQARAWSYGLRGLWDQPESVPTRLLPHCGLQAEFWLDPVDHDSYTDSGVYLYVSTDQVRFHDEHGQVLRLQDVPPLVFSEVLRDVDLFVGVASVASDPNWQDGGPEGRHRDYWWEYSFGDLTETAKTRRAVLEVLVPSLKIADRCALEEKYLRVRGSRRGYKIHLGSGNILMEPNNQYLCIVKGWDKAADKQKIRLPFEGDATLSLILSKAFLLAEDDKITDDTILSQIG
ncbi:MAG: DUF4132 domain-containing protein [Kiloniellales bacterium]|nr:DUF4132 domain-containing protein [Kiloniellales bacterium]